MIDLESKAKLKIVGKKLVLEWSMSRHTPLTFVVTEWDLEALQTIVVTDTSANDKRRRDAKHATDVRDSAVTGAVIGGVVDASSGDDGIVDGVLIGALFGAVSAGAPGKETAHIGLIFSDGSSLPVEVDRSEFTRLQTILAAKNVTSTGRSAGAGRTERKLSKSEIESILNARSSEKVGDIMAAVFSVLAVSMLIVAYVKEFHGSTTIMGLGAILTATIAATAIGLKRYPSTRQVRNLLRGDDEGAVCAEQGIPEVLG